MMRVGGISKAALMGKAIPGKRVRSKEAFQSVKKADAVAQSIMRTIEKIDQRADSTFGKKFKEPKNLLVEYISLKTRKGIIIDDMLMHQCDLAKSIQEARKVYESKGVLPSKELLAQIINGLQTLQEGDEFITNELDADIACLAKASVDFKQMFELLGTKTKDKKSQSLLLALSQKFNEWAKAVVEDRVASLNYFHVFSYVALERRTLPV